MKLKILHVFWIVINSLILLALFSSLIYYFIKVYNLPSISKIDVLGIIMASQVFYSLFFCWLSAFSFYIYLNKYNLRFIEERRKTFKSDKILNVEIIFISAMWMILFFLIETSSPPDIVFSQTFLIVNIIVIVFFMVLQVYNIIVKIYSQKNVFLISMHISVLFLISMLMPLFMLHMEYLSLR
ncbi:hypothetical protein AAEX28_12255 [Lentisphaerota bacterium WC36G]|nr:hypothetical protein LJT99_15085 [Lentisphaerae bacterium WC36]